MDQTNPTAPSPDLLGGRPSGESGEAGGLVETLGQAGLDPYSEPDRVQIVDTTAAGGVFALRDMTEDEEQRYGDEHVHTRWHPDTGEVTSWIAPGDPDYPRSGQARATGDVDDVLHRLEQRAGQMTRDAAGDALLQHQDADNDHGAGDAQGVEDGAGAARVAALEHSWDVAELLAEARGRAGAPQGRAAGGLRP